MIRFTLVAVFGLLACPAIAQDSVGYAQMAKATWSAFECSSLASKLKNPVEQERLFTFGYNQGKDFIAALQAGKIEREDLSSIAPIGILALLGGPSPIPDFMLGRIYEYANQNALRGLSWERNHFNTEEEQQLAAYAKFSERNCLLIGNGR